MNIMLIVLMFALSILFIFVSNFIIEKNGIKIIYLIYNIISFILSFKIMEIFQININTNIIFSSIFTSLTYLVIEKTTTKEYKEIIKEIFTINIIISILLLISSLYIGTINDTVSVHMNNIFIDNYKILISFPIITIINQIITLLIYNILKENKYSFMTSIILTNLNVLMLESILFSIASYIFKIKFTKIFVLTLSNYLIKVIITLIYTPFINYLLNKKKVKL